MSVMDRGARVPGAIAGSRPRGSQSWGAQRATGSALSFRMTIEGQPGDAARWMPERCCKSRSRQRPTRARGTVPGGALLAWVVVRSDEFCALICAVHGSGKDVASESGERL
jgi:hypothetical protein